MSGINGCKRCRSVGKIASSGLPEIVDHRRVIVPQLGGPGVAAHTVKKASGFKVVWGPIRAEDIPAFLANDTRVSPAMRRKTFDIAERTALIPMELVPALKYLVLLLLPMAFLMGIGGPDSYWPEVTEHGLRGFIALLAAVVAGAVLTPLLLPWLPGRAFSFKGLTTGLVTGILVLLNWQGTGDVWPDRLENAGWLVLSTALATFLAMNFTGASTFTSLSGVRKEMRIAIPIQLAAGVVGVALLAGSRWLA